MKALALTWAYNERDFLPWMIRHALTEGVEVLVFDNWSTDGTYEYVAGLGDPRVRVQRWPESGPTPTTSWRQMLRHTAATAFTLRMTYAWFLHWDADELRSSIRKDERLIDALVRFSKRGWNAADHKLELYAQRDGWDADQVSPLEWFTELVPSHIDHSNGQIKAWKQPGVRVDLASTAGHRVNFNGMRLAQEPLLLRHYPLRTKAQADWKIYERHKRWAPEERKMGFHCQYQAYGV